MSMAIGLTVSRTWRSKVGGAALADLCALRVFLFLINKQQNKQTTISSNGRQYRLTWVSQHQKRTMLAAPLSLSLQLPVVITIHSRFHMKIIHILVHNIYFFNTITQMKKSAQRDANTARWL